MSSVYFLIGRTLGKYKVLEHIGHGGMSEVYKGQQIQLHRPVAIKVLHPFLADDEGFVARFQREARIIATLRHPNIVQVYDFDYNKALDLYYMVMEYINGPTLKTRLEKESLSLVYISTIGAAIADALDYAHERGMIHRDIKPANIMFLEDGQPVLTDFGIAKMLTLSGLTASGAMVGTPAYMAPEIGSGKSGTSFSDIYALGVVLYQAVTGSLPFSAESPMGIVMQHINDPPPPPSRLVPAIPPALEAAILKAMEKDPAARFSHAREMAEALRQAVGLESPNGTTTPVPVSKSPAIPPSPPVRGVKILTPPSPALIADNDAPVKIIRTISETTGTPPQVDIKTPEKRSRPLIKVLRGLLIILVLAAAGAALWFGLAGGVPPAFRVFQTEAPQPTAAVDAVISNPTNTPSPTQTISPTVSPEAAATRTPTLTATPVPALASCRPRGRVDDVDIQPDEIVGPGSALMAIISLSNTGNCAWQAGTQLQYESGALLQAPEALTLNALSPGDTLQIHMALAAPQEFGTYTSVWQVRQPDGVTLGNRVKIDIVVEDLPTATPKSFPTAAPVETTPLPLALAPPVLETWETIPDSSLWQGSVHLQATGGTGSYRFYQGAVREETYIDDGRLTVTARRCDPLTLDIWVISGVDVLHWKGNLPYPEPGACE